MENAINRLRRMINAVHFGMVIDRIEEIHRLMNPICHTNLLFHWECAMRSNECHNRFMLSSVARAPSLTVAQHHLSSFISWQSSVHGDGITQTTHTHTHTNIINAPATTQRNDNNWVECRGAVDLSPNICTFDELKWHNKNISNTILTEKSADTIYPIVNTLYSVLGFAECTMPPAVDQWTIKWQHLQNVVSKRKAVNLPEFALSLNCCAHFLPLTHTLDGRDRSSRPHAHTIDSNRFRKKKNTEYKLNQSRSYVEPRD